MDARSRRWPSTAAARWSCSAPAGASRRSTSWPPRCCAAEGAGPTVIVSPAAGADAQPDRRRRARRHPRGDDQLHQHRGVGADPATRSAPARSTCCWSAPSGSTTPASATRCCPGWPRPAACSSSTRRTASPTGATTSGPTTAGSAPCSTTCPTASRCWPPPPPPTRGSPTTSPSSSGTDVLVLRGSLDRESLRLGVVRLPTAEQRLAWLADHLAEQPGSGIVYCLTVAATQEVADYLRSPRPRRRGVLRPDRDHRAAGPRAGPDRRPGQGAGRDQRARHGLRRRPSASWSTSGAPPSPVAYYQQVGRAGRGTDEATVVLLPGDRGPRHLGLLRLARLPARGAGPRRRWRRWPTEGAPLCTAALETRVELSRTRLETMLKVLDVDGAVRRVRGGWEATGQPWAYDAERYAPGRARPASASSRRCSTTSPPTGCRMQFLRDQLDDPEAGRLRPLRQLRRPEPRRRRCPSAAVEEAGARLSRPGVPIEPRKMWPTALATLGHRPQGQDRRRPPRRAAPSPGSPTSATARRCAALFRPGTPDGPVPVPLVQRGGRACSATGGPASTRSWSVESATRPTLTARPRRRARRATSQVPVRRPLGDRRPRRRARPGRGQLRPAGRRRRPPLRRSEADGQPRRAPGAARRRPGRHRLDAHARRPGGARARARRPCVPLTLAVGG